MSGRLTETLFALCLCATSGAFGFLAGRHSAAQTTAATPPVRPMPVGTIRFFSGSIASRESVELAQSIRESLSDESNHELLKQWRIVEVPGGAPVGRIGNVIESDKKQRLNGMTYTSGPCLVALVDGAEIGRKFGPLTPESLGRWVRSLRPWWRETGPVGIGEEAAIRKDGE